MLDGCSGQVRAVPAGQRCAGCGGQFAGQRFDRDDDVRGKNWGGASSLGLIGKSGQALLVEAFAPLGHHLSRGVQACGDLVVAQPLGRVEHDLSPHDV
jgi:hypothetical protein